LLILGKHVAFHHWRDHNKIDGVNMEEKRLEALELLRGANQEKGKISVLGRLGGYGVCNADWPGGPGKSPIFHMGDIGVGNVDCFDDQDWTYGENLND
jgi:hypothetical protein